MRIMSAGESATSKTYEKFMANLYGISNSHTEVKRNREKQNYENEQQVSFTIYDGGDR
ncbi:hypothetical protein [Nostoc parmelioides]|uniref:hypothetical protein n=1 Tax=Nostoc parmelioides TaxID=1521621 RepID=UPI0016880994|nr:hypothetical protein [Nostoc parmelioides]